MLRRMALGLGILDHHALADTEGTKVWVPPRTQVWTNTIMSCAALGFSIAAFALALVAVLR